MSDHSDATTVRGTGTASALVAGLAAAGKNATEGEAKANEIQSALVGTAQRGDSPATVDAEAFIRELTE